MGATQNYLMFFSYVGTGFRGSQIQIYQGCGRTFETVQYVIESGLKHVFRLEEGRPIRVNLASRTDKGVHALRAALQVYLPESDGKFMPPDQLKNQLNRYFRDFRSVRILDVFTVPDSFKISRAVEDKTYVLRCGLLKHEFWHDYGRKSVAPIMELNRTFLARPQQNFDLRRAQEATPLFEGKKDYGAILGKPSKNTKPTICNIMSFTVEEAQPLIPYDPIAQQYNYYNFTCRGDRFLLHMVRRMVSLVLSVGLQKITLEDIQKLFDKPVPSSWPRCVLTLPDGCGLYLVHVNIDLQKVNLNQENQTEKIPVVAGT